MTSSPDRIADRIRRFRDELHEETVRLGIPPESITTVAVSKTCAPPLLNAAVAAGMVEFGENRVQEAKAKIPDVVSSRPLRWHLIGHLQTNKAKDAVALFDLIQSVDSAPLAAMLNRRAAAAGKTQDILLQVNTSGEPQKSGCDPSAVDQLLEEVLPLKNLRLIGLMTIGPFVDRPAPIREAFHRLRVVFDRFSGIDLGHGRMRFCSMGMSGDWRIALAEGANMLRIGRAIFGERQ